MQPKITATKLGQQITEYKLDDFEVVKSQFVKFITVDQWANELKTMQDVVKTNFSFPIQIRQFPEQPGHGRVLYGVTQDERLVWLWSVIDSSD